MAEGSGQPEINVSRLAAVMQVMSDFDLTESQAWSDLDALSSNTYIDDLEVDPEGVIIEENEFKGVMNVYVVLHYGGNDDDAFDTSDAFRGQFSGHFDEDKAVVDSVTVDTSPFFEGESATA